MDKLNIKHLFSGKLTPLNLGDMSVSAALFTTYHIQNDVDFTMTVLTVNEKHFAAINVLGLPVFFKLESDTGDLELIKDIESALVDALEEDEIQTASVFVFKELDVFNYNIDDMTEKISNTDIYDDFFKEAINDYDKETHTVEEVDEELGVDDIQFKNIEVFDGNVEFELDVGIPEVSELLDDIIDIDEEITELKDMAQNMLEEADHITRNGYKTEDSEYSFKELSEDNNDDDSKFKEEDFYWDLTVEETEELGLTLDNLKKESIKYIDKEVSNMDDKVNTNPKNEFNERLDNMLEYMLSQSSVGHDPNYKYEYSKKGHKQLLYEDEEGKFLIENTDYHTEFDADNHVITLKITRREGNDVVVSYEESDLMDHFTMDDVVTEVKQNNKYLKNADAELVNLKTRSGKIIWKSNKVK